MNISSYKFVHRSCSWLISITARRFFSSNSYLNGLKTHSIMTNRLLLWIDYHFFSLVTWFKISIFSIWHCIVIFFSFESILSLNITQCTLFLLRFNSCLSAPTKKNTDYKVSIQIILLCCGIQQQQKPHTHKSIVRRNSMLWCLNWRNTNLTCWNMPTWRKKESEWITNKYTQTHRIDSAITSKKIQTKWNSNDDEKKWS